MFVFLGHHNSSWLSSNVWTALILFSLSFVLRKYSLYRCFFQPLLAICGYQDYLLANKLNFIFFGSNCSWSAWTSSSVHRIIFLKSFQKYVDGNSIPTFCWMLVTNFISIPSSFKKIIFNDSFIFLGEEHDFRKMASTNVTLKITVNKKLNSFQAMQWIKSENEVVPVQN